MTHAATESPNTTPNTKRFRKMPVEVEMVLWTGDNFSEVDTFIRDPRLRFWKNGKLVVHNTEENADIVVEVGYWVARGVKGELYPVSQAVLDASFEELDCQMQLPLHGGWPEPPFPPFSPAEA